jgi:glycosyltransferase involved in cell wall biosynthesis
MPPTHPSNVVAVILTKNEEINVGRCIESLRFCDEIIVLDSGSTDRTEEISRALGARFYVHVQPPPFKIAEQRNWILDNHALAGKWVLFMDADEVVPETLRLRLLEVAHSSPTSDFYELTPRYLFLGRWLKRTMGYPNWHARFLRHGSTRFTGGVWEHFSSPQKPGRIHEPYDHYAYSKGFSDWLARHDRYSSWDAEKAVEFLQSGDSVSLGTARRVGLRRIAARLWPLRPVGRFFHSYVIRLGFVEGWQALLFSLMYAFYELMTVCKIIEIRRRIKGLPL